MPHRILYVNSSGDFYGAERCLLNLVSQLDARILTPVVVVPFRGWLLDELDKKGVRTVVMPLGVFRARAELYSPRVLQRVAQWIPASLRLARLIRREKISLVHSNTSGVIAGALAAALARVPHVWHVREIIERPALAWSAMSRVIPRLAGRVVCISGAVKNAFHDTRDSRQFRVVYDGVDLAAFCPQDRSRDERLAVGMIARVSPDKGHEMFLRAARKIIDAHAAVRFIVAGGHLPQYKSLWRRLQVLTRELNLNAHVSFAGEVQPDDVRDVLASIDIFVSPTTGKEGLGQVVLEAMAMQKPVVATRSGGPEEVVVEGQTGTLVPRSNPAALAAAVLPILENQHLRIEMGRNGRSRIEKVFGLDQNIRSVEEIYSELLPPDTPPLT